MYTYNMYFLIANIYICIYIVDIECKHTYVYTNTFTIYNTESIDTYINTHKYMLNIYIYSAYVQICFFAKYIDIYIYIY